MHVNHVDLGVRISRLDTHVDIHGAMVIARRDGEAVEHDPQNAGLGNELELVWRVCKPAKIVLGKGELAAPPESLGLV